MSEPITWHDNGRITFDGLGDLRAPTFGELRRFDTDLLTIVQDAQAHVERIRAKAEGADEDEQRHLLNEASAFNRWGLIDVLRPWLDDVLATLGGLNLTDDSPAYFADASLPADMVAHWKRRPKASGPAPTSQ